MNLFPKLFKSGVLIQEFEEAFTVVDTYLFAELLGAKLRIDLEAYFIVWKDEERLGYKIREQIFRHRYSGPMISRLEIRFAHFQNTLNRADPNSNQAGLDCRVDATNNRTKSSSATSFQIATLQS